MPDVSTRYPLNASKQFCERKFETQSEDLHGGERDGFAAALEIADVTAVDAELTSHADLGEISLGAEFSQALAETGADILVETGGGRNGTDCDSLRACLAEGQISVRQTSVGQTPKRQTPRC